MVGLYIQNDKFLPYIHRNLTPVLSFPINLEAAIRGVAIKQDEMTELLKRGRIGTGLLCGSEARPDFVKLLAGIQIYVEGIAATQIQNLIEGRGKSDERNKH